LLATGMALAATPTQDAADSPSFRDESGKKPDTDQIIVRLKKGASSEALEEVNRRNGASIKKEIPRTRLKVVKLPQGQSAEEAAKRYEASPDIEYAEPDFWLFSDQTYNDPYYADGSLWGFNNTGQNSGTNDADIDAPEAWDAPGAWQTATGSDGAVVAVIDTGVDINHSDLDGNIWTNPNEIAGNKRDDDGNGYVDDIHGWDCRSNDSTVYDNASSDKHGTHVAGTIAAEGNSIGVIGVDWKAKVMPLKFMGPAGGYTSDAIECLNYAADARANRGINVKVSNNSWGGGGFNQSLKDAIENSGILFVAAASNEGTNNDTSPVYPSSYNSANIVAVAATDRNDRLASFSNYGSTSVDLAAPGVGIWSTLTKNTYGSYNGTSMATPHVAGTAALIQDNYPTLSVAGIRDRILNNVDKIPSLGGKTVTGDPANPDTGAPATGGRLNTDRAVRATG